MFIFQKLPKDIINYILIFDTNFKLRNGKVISLIVKNDYRYELLNYITIKSNEYFKDYFYNFNGYEYSSYKTYEYILPNLYYIEERKIQKINDGITVLIKNNIDGPIDYIIYIYRLKPKEKNNYIKKQIFYKSNFFDYEWHYINYRYKRF
jgi:hypothetical protein